MDVIFWFIFKYMFIRYKTIHLFTYKLLVVKLFVSTINLCILVFSIILVSYSIFRIGWIFLLNLFLVINILLEIYTWVYRINGLRTYKCSLCSYTFKLFDLFYCVWIFLSIQVFDDNSISFASMINIIRLSCFAF